MFVVQSTGKANCHLNSVRSILAPTKFADVVFCEKFRGHQLNVHMIP